MAVIAILLNATANQGSRTVAEENARTARETALFEARGGLRRAAERAARGEAGPWSWDGVKVALEGDRLRAEYASAVVTARRRGRAELFDWREE
jgi:hypothetical protein